jgi:hypothetical protein
MIDFVAEVGCTDGCAAVIRLRSPGFDLPALTLSTQLRRYAVRWTRYGGGRATRDASRRRFWAMAARTNSSWAPRGPRSRSRPSRRMRFKCANRISIFLRSCRDRSTFGISKRPGNVSGMLMDVARDLARRFFWAALRFEWTYIAVELAGAIQKCLALVYGAARSKPLSARAVVDVAGRIISKVAARRKSGRVRFERRRFSSRRSVFRRTQIADCGNFFAQKAA